MGLLVDSYTARAALVVLLCVVVYSVWPRKRADFPPIVHLSDDEIFNKPIESYERALRTHGPVIAVKRRGQMEIVVSDEFARQLLTDDANFSFERGVAKILNLQFMFNLRDNTFFKDMDAIISELVSKRLEEIIRLIHPVFLRNATALATSSPQDSPVDLFEFCQKAVSEAMVLIIFGKDYNNARNVPVINSCAEGVANLTGMYQNASYLGRCFPAIWRLATWLHVMVLQIGWGFGSTMGCQVWNTMTQLSASSDGLLEKKEVTLLSILVRKYTVDGHLSVTSRLWIFGLLISAVFASVHQTASVMVWVMYELSIRPECRSKIIEESTELAKIDDDSTNHKLTLEMLQNATYTDAFIREVMRTKGDTLSVVRMTTKDVSMGGCIIPKGCMVFPLTSLVHLSEEHNGPHAGEFRPSRWLESEMNKPAVMTGNHHIAFGLGRWACPGRFLAVAEMKLLVLTLVSRLETSLAGGTYTVVDKVNTTSVPPEGQFMVRAREFDVE